MSRFIPTLPVWSATALPQNSLFILYDPAQDAEFRLSLSQLCNANELPSLAKSVEYRTRAEQNSYDATRTNATVMSELREETMAMGCIIWVSNDPDGVHTYRVQYDAAGALLVWDDGTFGASGRGKSTASIVAVQVNTAPAATPPAAPVVTYDRGSRTLSYAATGFTAADLELSNNGGTSWQPYASVVLDKSAHAAGAWRARVKAATGRPASPATTSPAVPVYRTLVTVAGNSQSVGRGAEVGSSTVTAPIGGENTNSWGYQCSELTTALDVATHGIYTWHLVGQSGYTASQILSEYATRITPAILTEYDYDQRLCFLQNGYNEAWHDDANGSANAFQTLDLYTRASQDFDRVTVMTCFPFYQSGDATTTTHVNSRIDEYNGELLNPTNSEIPHSLAKLQIANIRTAQQFANGNAFIDTAISSDGKHCTGLGYSIVAHLGLDSILSTAKIVSSTYTLPPASTGAPAGTSRALAYNDPAIFTSAQGFGNVNPSTSNGGPFQGGNGNGFDILVAFTNAADFTLSSSFCQNAIVDFMVDGSVYEANITVSVPLTRRIVFNQGGHSAGFRLKNPNTGAQYLIADNAFATIWE